MIKVYICMIVPLVCLYDLGHTILQYMGLNEESVCAIGECYYTLSWAKFEAVMLLMLSVMWQIVDLLAVLIYFGWGAGEEEGNRGIVEEMIQHQDLLDINTS